MRQTLHEWCVQTGDETLLRQWNTEKNGDLTPDTVSHGSHYKAFWRCSDGHCWQAAVYTRTAGASCPYCAGKRVWQDGNDLATMHPDVAAEWHPTKNAPLTPSDVRPGTHRKVWWLCATGHEWQAEVKSRAHGCGCPICANRVAVPGYNDLATTYPRLAREWDAERNGGLTPSEVVAGSDRRVYWKCIKGHRWRAAISSRASGGCDCPYCLGTRVITGENDFATQYPAIAAEWDGERNGELTPDRLAPQSNRKAWWVCPLGHSYSASIASRVNRGCGCPYCAGRRVLPGFNDLATTEPAVAAQWYQPLNGGLTPETVTYGSSKRVFWKCSEGHIWKAVISSRAGKQKTGCPICAGKYSAKRRARYDAIMARAIAESPIQE